MKNTSGMSTIVLKKTLKSMEKFLTNSTQYYKKIFEEKYKGAKFQKRQNPDFWLPLGASKCCHKKKKIQIHLILDRTST